MLKLSKKVFDESCPNCNIISFITWDFIQPPDYFDHEKPHKIHFTCQNCDYEWVDDRKPYL